MTGHRQENPALPEVHGVFVGHLGQRAAGLVVHVYLNDVVVGGLARNHVQGQAGNEGTDHGATQFGVVIHAHVHAQVGAVLGGGVKADRAEEAGVAHVVADHANGLVHARQGRGQFHGVGARLATEELHGGVGAGLLGRDGGHGSLHSGNLLLGEGGAAGEQNKGQHGRGAHGAEVSLHESPCIKIKRLWL